MTRRPRLYLVTPPALDPQRLGEIAALMDRFDIACVRLQLATRDEEAIAAAARELRAICAGRAANVVIAEHFHLARPLGLDGVHLPDGARHVRAARRALGRDAIVGAFARASRHEGMTAAEIGADYVSFGPLAPSTLGDGSAAPPELFAWWAEMIETPVVAEGGVTPERAAALAPHVDFLALGEEVWAHPGGPSAAVAAIADSLHG